MFVLLCSKDSYENEIKDLKDKLNKANKIIEKQKTEIQDLKNQLNSFKNIDMNKINNLQNEINNKNNELNQLREQLQNINLNNNQNIQNVQNNLQNDKCVAFITTDSSLFYAIPCNGNSTFAEVEEKLCKVHNELRNTNNMFTVNARPILRFKKMFENQIKDGDIIQLFKLE